MFVRMRYGRLIDELQRSVSEISTAMSIYTSGTDPPGALSECGRSTVIVDCLSDLAGEVATTQYVQNAEVDQREETILSIQTDLYREKELLKAIEREIYSCNKIIWLAQSDLTEKKQECNQLNVAISFLVSECHQLEFQLLKAEEERRRINYETMMEMHAVRVGKQEKTLPLQKELEYLCSHMEDLKTQRNIYMKEDSLKILRGERQQEVQTQLNGIRVSLVEQKRENHHTEEKIKSGGGKIQVLKQEIELSKKRHAAQMTRLQHQVTDVQSQRRQWVEETFRINQIIQNIKSRIEE